ncbi:MAG: ADP-ribosylation/crystallin J1 [Planctomycetes bacterium]|nr:ADP-ribosylation/crystallin J1 [Planctomycetota bacterium]
MKLFRPVGVHELRLIARSGWNAFPPRLAGQPIFYPVLDEDYAVQIARDWNCTDQASGFAGTVLAFDVEDAFVARYAVQVVGGAQHRELWVPAEELGEFNRHIVPPIEVRASFYGERFVGEVDGVTGLPGDVVPPR